MRLAGRTKPEAWSHVSDEDVLQFADGELPAERAAQVRQHFEVCWECRTRLMDLQNTIAGFVHFQQSRFQDVIPPIDGPLAQLRARISAFDEKPATAAGGPLGFKRLWAICAFAAFLVMAAAIGKMQWAASVSLDGSKPIASLTPGETVPISTSQVCSANAGETDPAVPANLRERVFRAYGMSHVREQDFEVDYLITPDLGGAESLRNLWPEPYNAKVWNAHVKNRLEVRLRDLVCSGQVELKTAQRDLADDWIAAYRKYMGSEKRMGQSGPVAMFLALVDEPGGLFGGH